jgi:hypothetical protein
MSDPYRTPGQVGLPPDLWACPGCKRCYHVLSNARRRGDGKIVCVDCYRKPRA